MKLRRIISDSIVLCYIVSLLVYILVSDVLIKYRFYTLLDFSHTLIVFAGVGILTCIIKIILSKKKLDIFDLLICLLIIFGLISTYYAIDVDTALFGFQNRYEGFCQLILYYILFLNCKNIDNRLCKKILVSSIIVFGCIHAIYAILQFCDVKMLGEFRIIRRRFYSTGFDGNSNFFGSLIIVGLSLSFGIYFINKRKLVSIITLITSTILFFGLLCSGAMSVTIALFFLIMFLFISFIILKLNFKVTFFKCLLVAISCFACFTIFNKYDNGYYMSQVDKSAHEIGEALTGTVDGRYGTGRIHIWTETLKMVPNHIWNGMGIDNFALGNNELRDITNDLLVDKAHNEYLQKLITEGILSLLVYLILLLVLFIKGTIKVIKTREKRDYLLLALLLGFTSYCIQAFFNISVITVAPLFYIVMGLLCSMIKDDSYEEVKFKRNTENSVGDFERCS